MMKNIQEKRIENELSLIKNLENLYKTQIRKLNKEEYYITVTISNKLIEHVDTAEDIKVLIHLGTNFPLNPPKVYITTAFCFPNLCDGRDILEDIIGQNWISSLSLVDIINKIPNFLSDFLRQLKEGVLILVGNYYLGEKYDLSLLESLPVFVRKVKEKVVIDNKEKEIAKILMVSDIFFCLFDQEKWTKNNLHLTFWSNIRSLVTIKKLIKGDTCRFFWKQKNKKNNYEMVICLEDSNTLINLMLDKMSKFGINYKLSKQNLGPKEGVIPAIDIESVEKAVAEVEARVEESPDMELMQYLMSLYEQAVEFYSAKNDPRYEYYRQKIHTTLTSPRVYKFLQTSSDVNVSALAKDEIVDEDIKFKDVKKGDVDSGNMQHPIDEKNIIEKDHTESGLIPAKRNNNQNSEEEIVSELENKIEKENENSHVKEEEKSFPIEESIQIKLEDEEEKVEKNVNHEEENLCEDTLVQDKEKLICHIPSNEEDSIEIDNVNLNPIIASDKDSENKNDHTPEDKNLKNESIGVKLILVNDDEDQKVSISDEDSDEENEDD